MVSLNRVGGLLGAGLLFFSLCTGVGGQEPPLRFRVASNLILVDVRVQDSEGRPITGLSTQDFSIREEGVLQEIGYFQEIALPLTSSSVERLQVPRVPPQVSTDSSPPVALEKRLLILLFNLSSAGLQDVQMMRTAAQKFLEEQFTPDDAVAVLVFDNGLELLTDFTSDRTTLTRVLGNLSQENPELDLSLPGEDTDSEEDSASEFIADETEFALFETNQQLSAIQSVAQAFRDVLGRKALLYFSSGFTSRGVENNEQMRWTTDLSNRANISIYSVDTRGLVALSPGGGAQRAGGRGTGIFNGRSALNELISLNQSQEGLMTLAADTGGVALVDDNDLSKMFRQAQEDASHYYLIGYYTATPPSDGRFRRVEVRSTLTQARLKFRSGYYADRPYRSLSSSEREFRFLQTIVDDVPVADFPLEISAEYFPDASGQYQVPILLGFNHSQLSQLSGTRELNLEVILLARDTFGITRSGLRDKVEIRRVQEDNEIRFVYENLLVLDPGEYQLSAYLRDNRTGMMSQAVYPIDLPPPGPVRLSSLVLAGEWKQLDSQSRYRITIGKHVTIVKNPLEVQERTLIPRLNRKFTRLETLYLHGKVGIQGESQEGEYRIILLNDARERFFEGPWKSLLPGDDDGLDINARLPLNQLKEGQYQLLVEVRLRGRPVHLLAREFEVIPSGIPFQ